VTEPGGLSAAVIEAIKNSLIDSLKAKSDFKIYVFGSRAKNNYKKYSDLDLWIESKPSLNQREVTNILEKFEESDLAVKVDVVTPENCLPEYAESIQNEKKLWFTAQRCG
jgi:predicted nucleotidyltransferase